MLANWISETTTTTGTGTLSLGGAASADLLPFSSQFLSGDQARYDIKNGNNRETGIGTLTSGAPWTLARTTILAKLDTGVYTPNPTVGITLSGSSTVAIDATVYDISTKQIRFVSPQNQVSTDAGQASVGTQLTTRLREPYTIGSGDIDTIGLVFSGWWFDLTDAANYANAYTIVKVAIEIDGDAYSVPITFGGARSKVINPGDTDIRSDMISARKFSRSSIPRGTKVWIRLDYSVATVGQVFPKSDIAYVNVGYPPAIGITIDPAVFNGEPIDSFGVITIGTANGWTSFQNVYHPMIVGTFVAGDPATIIGLGDSILNGSNDTLAGYMINGGFMQGLLATDHVSDAVGGANFGKSGGKSSQWNSTNTSKLRAYLKYAKYAVEEYGTNDFNGTSVLATVKANSATLWTIAFANGIEKIFRTHLIPRTTADGVTAYNAEWASGGNARLFNSWLDTLVVPEIIVMNNDSLRISSSGEGYYQWAGGVANTVDGTHPNTAGAVLEAVDYRNTFATKFGLNQIVADSRFTRKAAAGLAPSSITVGASPFAYTSLSSGSVSVTGGTVSQITLTRNAIVVWTGAVASGVVPVCATDIVAVTYSAAPTMYKLSD